MYVTDFFKCFALGISLAVELLPAVCSTVRPVCALEKIEYQRETMHKHREQIKEMFQLDEWNLYAWVTLDSAAC